MAEAKANLADAERLLKLAEEPYRSKSMALEDFVKRQTALAVAKAQLDKAQRDLDLIRSGAWEPDVAVAGAAVAQAEAQVKQTEVDLDRLEVRASVAGRVLQRNVRPGEYVGSSPGTALIVLGDCKTLHVRIDVDESDLPRFATGMAGTATARGDAGRPIPLSFVRVEPFVVPKKALTGAGSERVDTRVLQTIYAVGPTDVPLYVGQQIDIYLDSGSGNAK